MEKSTLLVPAIGIFDEKKKTFGGRCLVCHSNYEDYIIHITTDYHKNRIRQSPFEKEIVDLCTQFEKSVKCQKPRRNGRFCKPNGTTKKHKYVKKA
jgi:hypothetical protein